jgi:shikimate kinase
MPGSGKTTVGRRLAVALGWSLIDSDDQIRGRFGVSGGELVGRSGVAALHRSESRLLVEALEDRTPAVICAAASVADSPAAVEALGAAGVAIVHLTADPETLASRQPLGGHRRPIGSEELETLAARRRATYHRLAGLTVDTGPRSPEETVETILTWLRLTASTNRERRE